MKTALKSPCYLVRNPYSYCFRMIVPKDLRKFVGKTELRYTLRTGNLRTAKHKAKLLAGQVQLIFRYLRKGNKTLSKLSDTFPDLFEKPQEHINQTTQSITQNTAEIDGCLLSEVIQNYVAENEKGNWTEKSKQENESSLNLFLEIMGDVPIRTLNRRQISEFKATLQKLPPNRNKVKKYRDKSIQELLEMDIDTLPIFILRVPPEHPMLQTIKWVYMYGRTIIIPVGHIMAKNRRG